VEETPGDFLREYGRTAGSPQVAAAFSGGEGAPFGLVVACPHWAWFTNTTPATTPRKPMPRLFTAIEIPPEVADRLTALRGGLPRARWIDPENYHLTLRFIGDVDRLAAEEAAEALSRIARQPFDLRISGVEALGTRKPSAIVARIAPSPALTDLQAEQERRLQRIGLPPEGRKYVPHVTIARISHGPVRDIAEYLGLRGGFLAGPFRVDRFVLLSSRDSVGGGPYVVEETYPLAATASRAAGGTR
jgi:2'-5' RNA ligase